MLKQPQNNHMSNTKTQREWLMTIPNHYTRIAAVAIAEKNGKIDEKWGKLADAIHYVSSSGWKYLPQGWGFWSNIYHSYNNPAYLYPSHLMPDNVAPDATTLPPGYRGEYDHETGKITLVEVAQNEYTDGQKVWVGGIECKYHSVDAEHDNSHKIIHPNIGYTYVPTERISTTPPPTITEYTDGQKVWVEGEECTYSHKHNVNGVHVVIRENKPYVCGDEHISTTPPAAEPQPAQASEPDPVNYPPHYTKGGIEVIDFIEAKGLQFNYYLANAIKYICRAGIKDPSKLIQDLKKAIWYIERYIKWLEKQ
jgi:hypothetical protein